MNDESVLSEGTEEEGLKDSDITLAGGDEKTAKSVNGDKLDVEVPTDSSTHLLVDVVEETSTTDTQDGGDVEKRLQQLESTNILLKQQAAVCEQQEKAEC